MLMDSADAGLVPGLELLGLRAAAGPTVMATVDGRVAVARETLRLVDILSA